ncbi:hypothetical protein Vretimale_2329 [Volvox reticuliferus]|uniref:Uncharacterized protein n=1 Tax=Volvox reticuliferus TaxID=1737510 RepID=A0A8J4C4Q2_9CHLO|nr:hypothetical protein Vretifemale_4612 [Volvox reticuliferus]GIL96537.1 hypothetical protein Vretimale_2329 [Volvox reticuliferus]
MLRVAEVAPGALLSPFQVELGAFCLYDREASEERSSEEHFNGVSQPTKLSNSGSRPLGVASSACRGVGRNSGVACAPWVPSFLAATYFQPCERHRHHKKNECTFFCITCGVKPHSVCQHCMGAHAGHQVIQVRRYVYCDVVRACDISPFVDASGVQNYIINSAKVMFLNHRPHSKIGRANGVDICRTCHRHLREGYSYCSLACKVEALTKGEVSPVGAPNAGSRVTAAESAAAATVAAGFPASCPPRSRPAGVERAPLGVAASYSSRPRSAIASAPSRSGTGDASAAGGPFVASSSVFAAPDSPDVAAADASCAALSSDPESSEPGEDTFVFGGGGGGGGGSSISLAMRGPAIAVMAAAAARRRLAPAGDRDWSSNGSASSKDEDDYCYEFNFENPPKRRRTSHITRRPSSSNGFLSAPHCPPPPTTTARVSSTDCDGADMEAAAAATAAATLLMPFRTTSAGLMPVAPAPSPPAGALSFFSSLDSATPAIVAELSLSRAASASVAMSSRRKQVAPQRAPSC